MAQESGFEAEVLAKLAALESGIHRPRVRHGWLRHVLHGLEEDPAVQIRVHKVACIYWLVNFPVIAVIFFGFPRLWVTVGLLLNTFYSLYANLATDYDGLSSSQASMHAREATAAASGSPKTH